MKKAFKWFYKTILWFLAISVGMVLLLRFVPPVTSSFMIQRVFEGVFTKNMKASIAYSWTSYENISRYAGIAVIASEDQRFPYHYGFDLKQIQDARKTIERGGRVRGASTISQQVAKNLFLWSGKTYFRKGLEAYFTLLIETLWDKRRILEVYLNIAEFGDGVYGVKAASQQFWKKPPANLTMHEAALLAAVLPNPKKLKANAPSGYVQGRASTIMQQIARIGGPSYIPVKRRKR